MRLFVFNPASGAQTALFECPVAHPALAIRTPALQRWRYREAGFPEDYDLLLRVAAQGPIAVAPEPLVRIWWHGASFFFGQHRLVVHWGRLVD